MKTEIGRRFPFILLSVFREPKIAKLKRKTKTGKWKKKKHFPFCVFRFGK